MYSVVDGETYGTDGAHRDVRHRNNLIPIFMH